MNTATDTATKMVLLKILKDTVAELDAEVRAEIDLDRGDRKAALVGGRRVGYVTMTDPKPGYRVHDGEAFRTWVRERYPAEVHATYHVNAAFEKALLATGHDENGEVPDGLEWAEGRSTVQVRAERDAADILRAYLDQEGLTLTGLIESLTVKQVGA